LPSKQGLAGLFGSFGLFSMQTTINEWYDIIEFFFHANITIEISMKVGSVKSYAQKKIRSGRNLLLGVLLHPMVTSQQFGRD
jgi:hypothetical protein